MSLIALGINHKTAPVEVREKAAFADHELAEMMAELSHALHSCEVAILSTCNRVEFYLASTELNDQQLIELTLRWIEGKKQLQQDLQPYVYTYLEQDAVLHLMRVASGLDSMVLGEPQILGQLKAVYQKARRAGSIAQVLERLFQKAFSAAKRVRHETEIGTNPVSVAYAAVSLAKHIFADFSQLSVLFVGAGETIELAARHLQQQNVAKMIMANRTLANGQKLANEIAKSEADTSYKAIGLEAIPHYLPQADIVISSTGSMLPIIGQGMVESAIKQRRRKSMFMVDLAVPRDIESSVAKLDDVYLYTVDDLEGVIQENMQARQQAAEQAEVILQEFVAEFSRWQAGREKHDTVRELRQKFATIAHNELERAKALVAVNNGDEAGPSQQEAEKALEELTHRLMKKFLHQPLVWLRQDHDELDTHKITRELFDLDND
ncbi:MAG: glutamyl-tRNA reductase [Kangiellaceae bacterium]|nr:glutamyl-tRNA reductase [Kangiellaceae bacterium]